MDFEAEIDRLYSLPFDEFITARNDLAKALRAKGQRVQADEVKILAKPNLPAWAVNQLWHGERAAFDRLLDAGTAARAAVVGKGTGGPRAATKRREATKALLRLAKDILSAAGHPNTSSTQQRITHTLDAAMALGAERLDPPLGRMTRDLEPQGFDVLAGLQPVPPRKAAGRTKKSAQTSKRARPAATAPRPSKIDPGAAKQAERERRVRAASKKLDDSLATLASAQKEAERAAETLAEARRRAAATARAASRAEKEAREASLRSRAAQEAHAAAAKTAKAADSSARKAGTAVKAARRRLEKAGG